MDSEIHAQFMTKQTADFEIQFQNQLTIPDNDMNQPKKQIPNKQP